MVYNYIDKRSFSLFGGFYKLIIKMVLLVKHIHLLLINYKKIYKQ